MKILQFMMSRNICVLVTWMEFTIFSSWNFNNWNWIYISSTWKSIRKCRRVFCICDAIGCSSYSFSVEFDDSFVGIVSFVRVPILRTAKQWTIRNIQRLTMNAWNVCFIDCFMNTSCGHFDFSSDFFMENDHYVTRIEFRMQKHKRNKCLKFQPHWNIRNLLWSDSNRRNFPTFPFWWLREN